MRALEERILSEGEVFPGNVLKVSSFLNHQLDIDFMMEMGKEVARLFEGTKISKILTIETSGIPFAACIAAQLHVPVVFAKKHKSNNVGDEVYKASIHSYTHGNDYTAVVSKEYISSGDFILLADDFLANGCALEGLVEMVRSAGAEVVGAAIAIEKGFQRGGDRLRESGIRVESLAIIDSMENCEISFRK